MSVEETGLEEREVSPVQLVSGQLSRRPITFTDIIFGETSRPVVRYWRTKFRQITYYAGRTQTCR